MQTTTITLTKMGTVLTSSTLDLAMENFSLTYLAYIIGGIQIYVSVSNDEFNFFLKHQRFISSISL